MRVLAGFPRDFYSPVGYWLARVNLKNGCKFAHKPVNVAWKLTLAKQKQKEICVFCLKRGMQA